MEWIVAEVLSNPSRAAIGLGDVVGFQLTETDPCCRLMIWNLHKRFCNESQGLDRNGQRRLETPTLNTRRRRETDREGRSGLWLDCCAPEKS